jgi:hypothetical protein
LHGSGFVVADQRAGGEITGGAEIFIECEPNEIRGGTVFGAGSVGG